MPARENSPRNLLTSLILVFPLFLIYQVGVLFTLPMLNGADFVTILLFNSFGLTLKGYLLFLTAVVALRARAGDARTKAALQRQGVLSGFARKYHLRLDHGVAHRLGDDQGARHLAKLGAGLPAQGLLTRIVMSLGAGVYEETVFRLGLLGGLIVTFEKLARMNRWAAVLGAFALSSAIFSVVHYSRPTAMPSDLGHSRSAFSPASCSACCAEPAVSRSRSTPMLSTTSSCSAIR